MDELVRRHHASVYRLAISILRDEDGAADVAQDAFLKAFRGLDRFRGDASFRTWLLTITGNEARGVLRKVEGGGRPSWSRLVPWQRPRRALTRSCSGPRRLNG
jgi:RNA polymerase sigma-70 factor (ECF subfamily)